MNAPRVRFYKQAYQILFTLFIIVVGVIDIVYSPFDEDEQAKLQNESEELRHIQGWVGNTRIFWWQTVISLLF